jgi:hypothetical protein
MVLAISWCSGFTLSLSATSIRQRIPGLPLKVSLQGALHPVHQIRERAIFCLLPERTGSMVDSSSSWVAQLQLGIPLRPCRKWRDQQSGHTAIPLAVQFLPL